MKIILHFPELNEASIEIIMEWIQEIADNKKGSSPLKFVERIELVKTEDGR